jgi:hypothetical protein
MCLLLSILQVNISIVYVPPVRSCFEICQVCKHVRVTLPKNIYESDQCFAVLLSLRNCQKRQRLVSLLSKTVQYVPSVLFLRTGDCSIKNKIWHVTRSKLQKQDSMCSSVFQKIHLIIVCCAALLLLPIIKARCMLCVFDMI